MKKILSILFISFILVISGCSNGEAAKGGVSGKPKDTCDADLRAANDTIASLQSQIVQLQNQLAQANSEYSLCSTYLTACNTDLAGAQSSIDNYTYQISQLTTDLSTCDSSLTQTGNDLSQCNTNLGLCSNTVDQCNNDLTNCEAVAASNLDSYNACIEELGTCEKFWPSVGQFGVVEEIDGYTAMLYLTQEQLDVECADPYFIRGVVMNDIYDWGPNNPDVNGNYNAKLDGVKRCYCGVGDVCYLLSL